MISRVRVELRSLISGVFVIALASFSTMTSVQSQTGVDIEVLGPQVGEAVPNFELPDQHGNAQTLDSILGANGAMLLFHRSADW